MWWLSKLGLTAIKEQSSKSDKFLQAHSKKAKEESKKDFVPNSAKTITGSMIKKFMCKDYKMLSKESEEKIGTTNYSSINQNIISPQTTPRVQLKEIQVNKR